MPNKEKNEIINSTHKIFHDILKETDYEKFDISKKTIRVMLQNGLSEEEVFAIYHVSSAFRTVYIGESRHVKNKSSSKFIQIGVVKDFAMQFFPDGFDYECLDDLVSNLKSLLIFSSESSFRVGNGAHISCLIKKITTLAKDYCIHDWGEFFDRVGGFQEDWWICEMLEISSVNNRICCE